MAVNTCHNDDLSFNAIADGSFMSKEEFELEIDSFYGQDEEQVVISGGEDGGLGGVVLDSVHSEDANSHTSATLQLNTSDMPHLAASNGFNERSTMANDISAPRGGDMEHVSAGGDVHWLNMQSQPQSNPNSNFPSTRHAAQNNPVMQRSHDSPLLSHCDNTAANGRRESIAEPRKVNADSLCTSSSPKRRTAGPNAMRDSSNLVVSFGEPAASLPQPAPPLTNKHSLQCSTAQSLTHDRASSDASLLVKDYPLPFQPQAEPELPPAFAVETGVKRDAVLPNRPEPALGSAPIMAATLAREVPSSEGKSSLYEDMRDEEDPPREKIRISTLRLTTQQNSGNIARPRDRTHGFSNVVLNQPSGRSVGVAVDDLNERSDGAGADSVASSIKAPPKKRAENAGGVSWNKGFTTVEQPPKQKAPQAHKNTRNPTLQELSEGEDELSLPNISKQSGLALQPISMPLKGKKASGISNGNITDSAVSPRQKQRQLYPKHITTAPLRDQETKKLPRMGVSGDNESATYLEQTASIANGGSAAIHQTMGQTQLVKRPTAPQQPKEGGRTVRPRGGQELAGLIEEQDKPDLSETVASTKRGGSGQQGEQKKSLGGHLLGKRELAGLVDEWNKPQHPQAGGKQARDRSVQSGNTKKPIGGHLLGKRELSQLADEWNKEAAPPTTKRKSARTTRAQGEEPEKMPNAGIAAKARRQGKSS